MSKKRARKRRNCSNQLNQKRISGNRRIKAKSAKNFESKLHTASNHVQEIVIKNISTPIKIEQNQISPKENIIDYYTKLVYKDFDNYSSNIFQLLLQKESKKENLIQINEKILSNFGLTKELRKYVFKYLSDILEQCKIPINFYFKTINVFDSFLINYSKKYKNDKKICSKLFISKDEKGFSETKLILLILCCFYIVNQINNSKNFDLKCLVNWDNKKEMAYDELNDFIYDILEIIDCEINDTGMYDFINIFTFDLNKRINIISKENIFLTIFNKTVKNLAIKIVQDISLNDILPTTQALGVIMFSIEYSKFLCQKYYTNEKINILIQKWVKSVKSLLINYNYSDIKRVIQWLNNYINTH